MLATQFWAAQLLTRATITLVVVTAYGGCWLNRKLIDRPMEHLGVRTR
jgi:hypothetical protein